MKIKLHGFRELEQALGEFSKATARNVANRALRTAAEPIAEAARSKAPVEDGALRDSIVVSPRLSKRQRRTIDGKGSLTTMHVGAGVLPQAHMTEFGTADMPPQPYMRPAWDAHAQGALDKIAGELGTEIDLAAKRAAAKAAKRRA